MTRIQKRNFLILLLASVVVLCVFIRPNLQGAKNVDMLSVFQPDEFAQYPYLIHMLNNAGQNLVQSVHTFLVYGHYYYGYPFYFFSGLALIPAKWILGASWMDATPILVMILREMINVLPMLIAVLVLVWMFTRYKSLWKSLLLFAFLETIPQVVANNLWWHPDSLLVLFSILTLFFLQRDQFRFGRNFFLSAIACGLAISSKVLGVLFVSTYAMYLFWGILARKISILTALKKAALFLLLMAAAVLISMPQLLMPQERAEIIAVFKGNLSENTQGFWVAGGGLAQNWQTFTSYIPAYYGNYWLILPALICGIAGLISEKNRLRSALTLCWAATYCGYFIFLAATLRPHYFLPVFLPLFACLAFLWEEDETSFLNGIKRKSFTHLTPTFWINFVSVVLVAVCLVVNTLNIVPSITDTNREANSPSIQFFNQVDQNYLSKMPVDKNFTLYRDWRAYIAPQSNWNVVMNWDLMDYAKLDELKPVVIFLEDENINFFSDAAKQSIALDPTGMQLKYAFYSDAKNDHIRGYVLLAENEFGKAFARQDLYDEYLKP